MKLFEENRTWARKVVSKEASRRNLLCYDRDAMLAEGEAALWDCCVRWDPTRCSKQFRYFASIRIRGAAVDYLRSITNVPRTVDATQTTFSMLDRENARFVGLLVAEQAPVGHELEVVEELEAAKKIPIGRARVVFELVCAGYRKCDVARMLKISNWYVNHLWKNAVAQIVSRRGGRDGA